MACPDPSLLREVRRRRAPNLRAGASLLALVATFLWSAWAEARTEPSEVAVGDVRFVVDAADGMAGFVEETLPILESDWPSIAAGTGATGPETIYVHIEREFDDWFERNGLRSRPPEWAAGLAIPSRRVIILAPGNPRWQSTLVHEMVHVAIGIASGDADLPRWFDEGYSVALAEQWGLDRATTMIKAGVTGNLLEFESLEHGFPASATPAGLAYAQSFHLVRYVRDRFGQDVFVGVLERVRGGTAWEEAFRAVTGVPLATVVDEWEEHLSSRYRWMPIFTGTGASWGAIAILALTVWRRRKAKNESRLADLERREREMFSADPDDQTFS